ncbi:FecR family protein [Sphingobacterium tabacisoli]|uniref:FecR family protein n=1 Tax=Sphingobacterium tabacisoli TaxID=2044855 RepID=A0ABW5L5H0_9SPHI|nr:FecR domain-containing protein [Sphingobacterium tabacisoli]
MEDRKQRRALFERYLDGNYSQADVDELLTYFGAVETELELRTLIDNALQEDVDFSPLDHQIKQVDEAAFERLQAHIAPVKVRYWPVVRVAASILIVLGLGWAIYQYTYSPAQEELVPVIAIDKDIAPGTDRATLFLDDGQSFVLDRHGEGIVNSEGEVRYQDGQLLVSTAVPRQVTLRTPIGGQYQATLPDGTKVWLNAASEIRYPSTFDSKYRHVSIKGEVYLEVAKDAARPFTVETEGQRVAVLGTHFNINAYGDNGAIWTTLSEGHVRVTQAATGQEIVLSPGQQVQNHAGAGMKVREVDLEQVLAWKEGMYILRNQEIGLFGKQIERWYDVEVDMGAYADRKVSAIVPRSAKLSAVLEAITLESGIQFKREGRRVTAIGK